MMNHKEVADNPYQPPETETETTALPRASTTESSRVRLLLTIVGTVTCGLLAKALGTLVARVTGLIPGSLLHITDMFEIRHGFDFAFLIVGCFFGAWVGQTIAKQA